MRVGRRSVVALALAHLVLLAGCTTSEPPSRQASPSPTSSPQQTSPAPPSPSASSEPVRLAVTPRTGARDVSPTQPVAVSATGGRLVEVSMVNPEGRAVRGTLSPDGSGWTSAEPLGYGRRYAVTAAASGGGKTVRLSSTFSTVTPRQLVFPSFFPPPSMRTVGVGQPLAVIFSRPVPDRAAAERALSVRTEPAVTGSWYWFDERTVHYRPQKYWAPGTKITMRAGVYGVDLGDGVYGETDRQTTLTIGRSKIAVIDDRTKQMTVYVDGKKALTAPVSMGRPGSVTVNGKKISFLTQSGIHVVQEKYPVKQMSSATYGLPTDADLGYDSRIPLAVRISNSGEFVHSAPWSVKDQGRRNVSHGCVNLPPKAAQWFYRTFSYGDIVDIRNTGATLRPDDGFGDWNIRWDRWLAGSALR